MILLARRQDKLAELAEEIRAVGAKVEVVAVDVTDRMPERNCRKRARVGPIDLLVANAGMGTPTPAKRFSAESFERVIAVNLVGVANCVAFVLPSMIERGGGQLVGIASLAGYRGLPGSGAYCASKAGLRALFESLRIDLARTPIAVTTICPGFVRTPMTDQNKFSMPFLMELEPLDKIERQLMRVVRICLPFTLATIADSALVTKLHLRQPDAG